jgi:hypothetical protein
MDTSTSFASVADTDSEYRFFTEGPGRIWNRTFLTNCTFMRDLRADPGHITCRRATVHWTRGWGKGTGLELVDPCVVRPDTKFTPPGWAKPVNVRRDWKEGESHYEIWGSMKLWVKRENDGWSVPAS